MTTTRIPLPPAEDLPAILDVVRDLGSDGDNESFRTYAVGLLDDWLMTAEAAHRPTDVRLLKVVRDHLAAA